MADREEPDTELDAQIEDLLRSLDADDMELVEPPDTVWAGIESELATDDNPSGQPSPADDRPASVSSLRRHRGWISAGLAAAAGLIVVAAVGLFVADDNGADDVLAVAELTYDEANFDELGSTASAEVVLVDEDGQLYLRIEESELPDSGNEDLELWLIEPDEDGNVAGIVSLGLVDPDDLGRFTVPSGYDPSVYVVVDISVEPRDGIDTHSGRSILRGPFVTA